MALETADKCMGKKQIVMAARSKSSLPDIEGRKLHSVAAYQYKCDLLRLNQLDFCPRFGTFLQLLAKSHWSKVSYAYYSRLKPILLPTDDAKGAMRVRAASALIG